MNHFPDLIGSDIKQNKTKKKLQKKEEQLTIFVLYTSMLFLIKLHILRLQTSTYIFIIHKATDSINF